MGHATWRTRMFWSKARKIKQLQKDLKLAQDLFDREQKMCIAAQNSDREYRKLATERLEALEQTTKARDLILKEFETKNNDYTILSSTYEDTRHVIEKKNEEIESLKLAYEHERRMRDEFERELGKVRGELARALGGTSNSDTPPDPLTQVDNFARDEGLKF